MIQFILHHSFILFSSRLTKGMFQIFIHHLFVFHTLHYYCKRKSLIFSSYFCCSPKLDYLCMWKGAIHLRLHLLSWHFCLYFLFSLYVLHVHISVAEEMLPHIPSCTIFIKFQSSLLFFHSLQMQRIVLALFLPSTNFHVVIMFPRSVL